MRRFGFAEGGLSAFDAMTAMTFGESFSYNNALVRFEVRKREVTATSGSTKGNSFFLR